MANKRADEQYMHFTFHENGKSFTRRLHRLEVQGPDGKLYILTGKDLPDMMSVYTGTGYKGEHLGEILLKPLKVRPWPKLVVETRPWPSSRDVLNIAIGLFVIAALNFISSVVAF